MKHFIFIFLFTINAYSQVVLSGNSALRGNSAIKFTSAAAGGGGLTAPTLITNVTSGFNPAATPYSNSVAVSWNTDDWIIILGVTEDSEKTIPTPTCTGSGVTMALLTSSGVASDCFVYAWTNKATASSSGYFTAVGGLKSGIRVFIYRSSGGIGAFTVASGANSKTISLTRGSDNSAVVMCGGDWVAIDCTSATATPTGTVYVGDSAYNAGAYAAPMASFGDQGAAGTTSYGFSYTGTVDMARIAIEVKGQ